MRNYVQTEENIIIVAPAITSSGDGVLVGSLFGIAASHANPGDELVIVTKGVFTLPKAKTQAWAIGDKVYWDDTAKACTTTATNNVLIGVAIVAVANPSLIGTVRLNGGCV